jgi:hypothetical protein
MRLKHSRGLLNIGVLAGLIGCASTSTQTHVSAAEDACARGDKDACAIMLELDKRMTHEQEQHSKSAESGVEFLNALLKLGVDINNGING